MWLVNWIFIFTFDRVSIYLWSICFSVFFLLLGALTPRSSAEVEENTSASNRILWLTDSVLKSLFEHANDEAGANEWMVMWAAAAAVAAAITHNNNVHGEKSVARRLSCCCYCYFVICMCAVWCGVWWFCQCVRVFFFVFLLFLFLFYFTFLRHVIKHSQWKTTPPTTTKTTTTAAAKTTTTTRRWWWWRRWRASRFNH